MTSSQVVPLAKACERAVLHCATIGGKVRRTHLFLSELVRFFDSEPAARSVTYKAVVRVGYQQLPGEVEITRDGDCKIRLNH